MPDNFTYEKMADYQYYVASGSHYEIGKITANKGKSLINSGQQFSEDQLNYAKKCKGLLQDYYPEIIYEFKGYQDALKLQEDELLPHFSLGMEGGCSAIAVKTPEGMLIGRNYDYYYFENRRHLIKTIPNNGYSHVGMHEGLVGGRFDGMNEKGLFVCFNGAGKHSKIAKIGISFHLIVRLLLEKCATAKEARDTLLSLPIKEPKSYLLVDTNEAFVVEADIYQSFFREMLDQQIVLTNHFVHPLMNTKNIFPNSVNRFNKLENIGRAIQLNSKKRIKKLKELMADHSAPLCGHHDGLATFWSCVGNLTNLDIQYCLGSPCRNKYITYF